MQPKYEVPIIPHNLRREETIIQIAEALQYLSDVSTDIFKRIDSRIAANKTQVTNISDRIATASTKLNKLAGAKKATQVFSSSKYPAENINRQYKSIFDQKQVLPIKKFDYEYKSSQVGDENLEALQFYYVKVKAKAEKSSTQSIQGLGELPSDLETINDILLFNTGRNAYDKEKSLDRSNNSLLNTNRKGRDDSEVDIGAAPFSMSQGQGLGMQKIQGENYFYSPHLGNVPTIDVPLDLPDLPGIADDLRYTIEQEPNIAPSVSVMNLHLGNTIPDLPEIEDNTEEKHQNLQTHAEIEKNDNKVVTNTAPAVDNTQTVVSVPSAATTTGQEVKTVKQNVVNKESNVKKEETKSETSKPKSMPPIAGDNARASLMDAIRNAGGSKSLKHKEESPAQNKKQPEPVSYSMLYE